MNVPEFFADPAFRRWLQNDNPKFTRCRDGAIDEWPDVVVLVDPSLTGEGSDSDMPKAFWTRIVDACQEHLGIGTDQWTHYMVRLTNLGD
ncbi:hypothetical protein [uncultured Sphingomonas sp.]|uniref:hypothetical protein n=1 Tax=uncultured Sphingomonas sp. TaxID=158754 RepID=UPI002633F509|nr:hypothetical protein [uncultured Sphingomonas sp.]